MKKYYLLVLFFYGVGPTYFGPIDHVFLNETWMVHYHIIQTSPGHYGVTEAGLC